MLCWLFYYYCSVLADYQRFITGDLQEVGLQGPDKEAPTSHRIPRINNELSRPTEGVRFCLSGRSAPFHRESLFESNTIKILIIYKLCVKSLVYENSTELKNYLCLTFLRREP